MKYEYHHMGIPTTEKRDGERYVPKFKMYSSGYEGSESRVQWHRFEPGCELHPLIQTVPHVAFKVDDLDKAIEGKKVILGPYYPRFPLFGYSCPSVRRGAKEGRCKSRVTSTG